ncbi:MAG: sugar phosphate isomerase/epimerase [Verrucomicrobia bacterium]|nr:sugar phosphate isomerase/epimerase [Verrucomicrobiota bacterium]
MKPFLQSSDSRPGEVLDRPRTWCRKEPVVASHTKRGFTTWFGAAIAGVFLAGCGVPLASRAASPAGNDESSRPATTTLFARTNLVAWCIVPFDAGKRTPAERAAMLQRLGFGWLAYDYRAEHVPTFDDELVQLKKHNVRLLAWWFPGELNEEARHILDVLKRHDQRGVQLWVSGGGEPVRDAAEEKARIEGEVRRLRPIAEAAARQDCVVALYNHGGWFGEPENQIKIIQRLKADGVDNVGIVYNQHHGHAHLDRFEDLLRQMKPHLLAFNLNGMTRDGDQQGKKILPLGQGDLDLKLLRILRDSGWQGPIGLLNHTDEDAETRLRDNLAGLDRLVAQLDAQGTSAR